LPFFLESAGVDLKQLTLRRVVNEQYMPSTINSGDNNIMQQASGRRLEGDDQRTPVLNMVLQEICIAVKHVRVKAPLVEVALKVRRVDSMGLAVKESLLNVFDVRACDIRLTLAPLPVLHHHGDAGRAAAFPWLLDKRNVNPSTALLWPRDRAEA
jgi:hypothetical protein